MAGATDSLDESLLEQASAWRREGRGVAVATVVDTWGSSPRPVGSQLIVDTDGQMMGPGVMCPNGATLAAVVAVRCALGAGIADGTLRDSSHGLAAGLALGLVVGFVAAGWGCGAPG